MPDPKKMTEPLSEEELVKVAISIYSRARTTIGRKKALSAMALLRKSGRISKKYHEIFLEKISSERRERDL